MRQRMEHGELLKILAPYAEILATHGDGQDVISIVEGGRHYRYKLIPRPKWDGEEDFKPGDIVRAFAPCSHLVGAMVVKASTWPPIVAYCVTDHECTRSA